MKNNAFPSSLIWGVSFGVKVTDCVVAVEATPTLNVSPGFTVVSAGSTVSVLLAFAAFALLATETEIPGTFMSLAQTRTT